MPPEFPSVSDSPRATRLPIDSRAKSHSFGPRSPFLPTTNSDTLGTTCSKRSTARSRSPSLTNSEKPRTTVSARCTPPPRRRILYAIDEIGRFQDDYKDVVVSRVVRDYSNIRALAIGAQATLAQGRGSRASVQQQTTEYMELFRQLRDAVRVLDGSRDDLNAMIDEDRAKEQSESRRFLLQFVVRVAGSLLAAMGLIWTIWYTLTSGDAAPGS